MTPFTPSPELIEKTRHALRERGIINVTPGDARAAIAVIAPMLGEEYREKLAAWMIRNSFATGHGDTIDDLLTELTAQVVELRARFGVQSAPTSWEESPPASAGEG